MKRFVRELITRVGLEPPEWLDDPVLRKLDRDARFMDRHLEEVYQQAADMVSAYKSIVHLAAAAIANGRMYELRIDYAARYLHAECDDRRHSYRRPNHAVQSFEDFCRQADAILLSYDDIDFLFDNVVITDEERWQLKESALLYAQEQATEPGLPPLRVQQAPNSQDTILVFDL